MLKGDSIPDPQNQLKLKFITSIHWTTLIVAENEAYIPSL